MNDEGNLANEGKHTTRYGRLKELREAQQSPSDRTRPWSVEDSQELADLEAAEAEILLDCRRRLQQLLVRTHACLGEYQVDDADDRSEIDWLALVHEAEDMGRQAQKIAELAAKAFGN